MGSGFRGEARPYAARRVQRFELHGARRIDLRPAAAHGDLEFARFVLGDGGGALIAYQTDFAAIELPAAEFDAYLDLEGLIGPRAARRQLGAAAPAGRERYARCARVWIAGAEPARCRRRLGLTLEIVPLADPTQAGRLPLRVLYRGKPLPGALVRAWNAPLAAGSSPADAAARDSVGPAAQARTAADGSVTLDVSRPGEWMIGAVHMVPARSGTGPGPGAEPEAARAEWESVWSTFTFARTRR